MGNQIFISYRRKDGFYPAYLLYKELIGQNFTVFFDLKSLRTGVFPDIIRQNIEDCTDFILIVSDSTFSQRIFQKSSYLCEQLLLSVFDKAIALEKYAQRIVRERHFIEPDL